ncbi:uroporphyrinogen-III C-methyltransferase [uncultured Anaerovibrio sp.]|uniref:uroporphyrinogen-III C-methyltransferase n=1 Tax=uncultured Anaerovibrio sp. TaxID=361586 RepID=UPI0026393067|nr:uroporphyrinogen-III C-methyltransferase [uncultured Anaerovibrio sp.]
MAGKVFLVGAGPGDYRLLTLKACDCLKIADTVVYDRLADKRILQYASNKAELIYVGKASSQHTMSQDKICQLLVDLAKAGKTVVRLKGGDPFVFGRGGEEALLLQENDLPFEIVPGVTSAISVPAYAGIPVTHRGVAASFAVITGHEDPTKEASDINWKSLATATDTLVFLMGVANLSTIAAQLINNGRKADTPVAIIRWGTKPGQKVWIGTLSTVADMAQREGIKPPCIILVGEVVKLRQSLTWFDNVAMKPLFGKRVLVTRARTQASKLTAALEEMGAECIEAPVIAVADPRDGYQELDGAIDRLAEYQWIIFTSTNGVEHFWSRLEYKKRDARALYGKKVCAIGAATAQALAEHGIRADVVPARYQAEGIVEALKNELAAGDNILIPRAAVARELLPAALSATGANVDVVPAYETIMGDLAADDLNEQLKKGDIDVITFTSSSTVVNLLKIVPSVELLKNVRLAAIGPVTAETMGKYGLRADIVAEEYTIEGLVESIRRYYL